MQLSLACSQAWDVPGVSVDWTLALGTGVRTLAACIFPNASHFSLPRAPLKMWLWHWFSQEVGVIVPLSAESAPLCGQVMLHVWKVILGPPGSLGTWPPSLEGIPTRPPVHSRNQLARHTGAGCSRRRLGCSEEQTSHAAESLPSSRFLSERSDCCGLKLPSLGVVCYVAMANCCTHPVSLKNATLFTR